MLFVWKRTLGQIACATGILLGAALLLRAAFDIPWVVEWRPRHTLGFVICLAVVVANDFGIHALGWRFLPTYKGSYRALVEHFAGAHRLEACSREIFLQRFPRQELSFYVDPLFILG